MLANISNTDSWPSLYQLRSFWTIMCDGNISCINWFKDEHDGKWLQDQGSSAHTCIEINDIHRVRLC